MTGCGWPVHGSTAPSEQHMGFKEVTISVVWRAEPSLFSPKLPFPLAMHIKEMKCLLIYGCIFFCWNHYFRLLNFFLELCCLNFRSCDIWSNQSRGSLWIPVAHIFVWCSVILICGQSIVDLKTFLLVNKTTNWYYKMRVSKLPERAGHCDWTNNQGYILCKILW